MLIERLDPSHRGRRALFNKGDCSPTSKLVIAVTGVIIGGAAQYVVRRLWVQPWVEDKLEEREIAEVLEGASDPFLGLLG